MQSAMRAREKETGNEQEVDYECEVMEVEWRKTSSTSNQTYLNTFHSKANRWNFEMCTWNMTTARNVQIKGAEKIV